uniref:Uncharacterized protein n=1 Tax=Amphimedon queenslandica TaxID=400682 RepID=A0A1X7U6R2_AMPQE
MTRPVSGGGYRWETVPLGHRGTAPPVEIFSGEDSETHSSRGEGDFICRLAKTFRKAYGHDEMYADARDALMYAQLQEGLIYDLIKAPAISGATDYLKLCVAAKNEEKS